MMISRPLPWRLWKSLKDFAKGYDDPSITRLGLLSSDGQSCSSRDRGFGAQRVSFPLLVALG